MPLPKRIKIGEKGYFIERLPEETNRSYGAFLEYLKMPLAIRTYDGLLEKLKVMYKKFKYGDFPAKQSIMNWAFLYKWNERVKPYDELLQREVWNKMKALNMEVVEKQLMALSIPAETVLRKMKSEKERKQFEQTPTSILLDMAAQRTGSISTTIRTSRLLMDQSEENKASKQIIDANVRNENVSQDYRKRLEAVHEKIKDEKDIDSLEEE